MFSLTLFPLFIVVLLTSSPAYFRGFTLIALKEGREGTTDDDYAGQFQVSLRRCGEESLHMDELCVQWEHWQKGAHLQALLRRAVDEAAPCCSLMWRIEEVFLTETGKELRYKRKGDLSLSLVLPFQGAGNLAPSSN